MDKNWLMGFSGHAFAISAFKGEHLSPKALQNDDKMHIQLSCLSVALICVILQITSVQSQCQTCNDNGAYCESEDTYYLCLYGTNPSKSYLYRCDDGQVCTASEKICEPRKGDNDVENNPVCGESCNKCLTTGTNTRFTCVSKTQIGRCVADQITTTAACDPGYICSSELYAQTGVICAPQCVADFYDVSATCSNDQITTTTTTIGPIDPESLNDQCLAADTDPPQTTYFNIKNADDPECKTYINCERFDDGMEALLMKCTTGYFDPTLKKCGTAVPAGCTA